MQHQGLLMTSPFNDEVFCRPATYQPVLINNTYTDTFVGLDFRAGLKCPCMPGTTQVWQNLTKFKNHAKTSKRHHEWLQSLTRNAADIYSQYLELQAIAEQRAQINMRLENELVALRTRCAMLEKHIAEQHIAFANIMANGINHVSIDD